MFKDCKKFVTFYAEQDYTGCNYHGDDPSLVTWMETHEDGVLYYLEQAVKNDEKEIKKEELQQYKNSNLLLVDFFIRILDVMLKNKNVVDALKHRGFHHLDTLTKEQKKIVKEETLYIMDEDGGLLNNFKIFHPDTGCEYDYDVKKLAEEKSFLFQKVRRDSVLKGKQLSYYKKTRKAYLESLEKKKEKAKKRAENKKKRELENAKKLLEEAGELKKD